SAACLRRGGRAVDADAAAAGDTWIRRSLAGVGSTRRALAGLALARLTMARSAGSEKHDAADRCRPPYPRPHLVPLRAPRSKGTAPSRQGHVSMQPRSGSELAGFVGVLGLQLCQLRARQGHRLAAGVAVLDLGHRADTEVRLGGDEVTG